GFHVTGVQTCALPIYVIEAEAALDAEPTLVGRAVAPGREGDPVAVDVVGELAPDAAVGAEGRDEREAPRRHVGFLEQLGRGDVRSEERRVGKESTYRR